VNHSGREASTTAADRTIRVSTILFGTCAYVHRKLYIYASIPSNVFLVKWLQRLRQHYISLHDRFCFFRIKTNNFFIKLINKRRNFIDRSVQSYHLQSSLSPDRLGTRFIVVSDEINFYRIRVIAVVVVVLQHARVIDSIVYNY